jgi:capsular exopolysaccharide synthesis family protein
MAEAPSPLTETESGRDERDTLATALRVLRRRWLIVVGVVIVCMAAAGARYASTTKSYEATANVAFDVSSLPDAALQVSRGSGDPERDAATNVLVASSSEVAELVRRELRSPADPGTLLSAIDVEAAPNANVLDITASTSDATYSARLANSFADQFIAFQTASQLSAIDAAERDLQTQIDALPVDSPDRATLQQSLQRLNGLRAVATSGSQVIGRASPPGSASGSSMPRTLVLGALIGLALALAIVFLLESLDRRVTSIEEFEREYRLPALAAVPQESFKPHRGAVRDAQLEPYRILRSALDFAAVTRELDTLLVTSAISAEGKTTVAVELAHAIALTGRSVALVEFDLRRPTLAQRFGLDPSEGVTSVLTGQEELQEALVRPLHDLQNLAVLPAGQLPPNPSELLGAPNVAELLEELAHSEGTVIVDAPPLNPVADAQVLLNNPAIDGTIIVARAGHTTRDDVRRASGTLARHVLQPVGVVVTGIRGGGRYSYAASGGQAVFEPAREQRASRGRRARP